MATQNDKRVALLSNLVAELKGDRVLWEPLIKAAERYQATLKVLQSTSLQFVEALGKVAQTAANANSGVSDLGVGIHQIAETFRDIEAKRSEMIKSMMDDFITPLGANLKNYEKIATKFEKDYVKDHKQAVSDLKEAEKSSAKAAKKGAEALRESIQTVNAKVKEMEELRKSRLKGAIVEQRKRYCFVIMHMGTVIKNEIDMHEFARHNLSSNLGPWTQLAVSPDTLPPAVEELVEVQQRTLIPIQADGNVDYSDYYADSGYGGLDRTTSFSSSSLTDNLADYPTTPVPEGIIRAGDQVVALFDYHGKPEELSLREGDTVTVMEADGSGWCLGDLRGAVGWFPANYVQKVARSGGPPLPPKVPKPGY